MFYYQVLTNIQCETLFLKHKSRFVCIYWYTYLQDITSLQDWFDPENIGLDNFKSKLF